MMIQMTKTSVMTWVSQIQTQKTIVVQVKTSQRHEVDE